MINLVQLALSTFIPLKTNSLSLETQHFTILSPSLKTHDELALSYRIFLCDFQLSLVNAERSIFYECCFYMDFTILIMVIFFII